MHPPINHFTNPDYWTLYHRLPEHIQLSADKCFALLKSNPKHPSLHLKKIGDLWSVRAGIHYRAVGMDAPGERSFVNASKVGPVFRWDQESQGLTCCRRSKGVGNRKVVERAEGFDM